MKKPNDENGQFEDIYSASEDIRPTGERVPVQQDERTVKDDANDYLYLKTKRTHHHSEGGTAFGFGELGLHKRQGEDRALKRSMGASLSENR